MTIPKIGAAECAATASDAGEIMGKHETSYPRIDRDHYPTPSWVVEALAEYVSLIGRTIWECATGAGHMAEALKAAGAARVYCSDIAEYSYPLDEKLDFVSAQNSKLSQPYDAITNPPFGVQGKLAETFIAAGLRRTSPGGLLALLLPVDFDSAKTRAAFFRDCPHFIGKIVLTRRIVWFERTDGIREAPKENSDMVRRTVRGGEPTEKQASWLRKIYARARQ
jgi:hypothetical protein